MNVSGIEKCDRNKFNGTLKELKEFWLSESSLFHKNRRVDMHNVSVSFTGELAQYLIDMTEIENKTIEEVLVNFVKEAFEAKKEKSKCY